MKGSQVGDRNSARTGKYAAWMWAGLHVASSAALSIVIGEQANV